jgi:hypothetical protein
MLTLMRHASQAFPEDIKQSYELSGYEIREEVTGVKVGIKRGLRRYRVGR